MTTRILALCGSLRRDSKNLQVLHAALPIAERLNAEITIGEFRHFPAYDADVQAAGIPSDVEKLGRQIQQADAVLIVSPEYNYSVPGVLKNAIDWLSRLSPQPFAGKAVAIMGTSPGALGTSRMQYHLRQTLVFLDAHAVNKPEVMIGAYGDKFDANGALTDAKALEMIERLLVSLIELQQKLASPTST